MSRTLIHWVETHTTIVIHRYIDSNEEVVSLFQVEFQKPRNLSVIESEESGYGVGVRVYCFFLSLFVYYESMK
jgi:hypothetical protein